MNRRHFFQVGTVAVGGLALPGPARGSEGVGRARACILLYMDGGPSHIDLWDLKPEAPAEIRGPFRPIPTSVPGVTVSELLPQTALRMHLLTQVRSVRHEEAVHDPAVYQMLTGRRHVSSAGNLKVQDDDFPQMAAAFARVDRARGAMPTAVALPETMTMGGRVLPGQNAGFLGRSCDPFRVEVTPGAEVVPPEFGRWAETPPDRRARRASLLGRFDHALDGLRGRAEVELDTFDRFHRQAIDLLGEPRVR
ncbi:MAG: DUF1501 domain-containing protein, partial [Planctomycetia bacterium]|nr:DUF1501 domain-containing protein [Planctomycetia bacterium]